MVVPVLASHSVFSNNLPPFICIRVPTLSWQVFNSTSDTLAIDGKASPRNPRELILNKSSLVVYISYWFFTGSDNWELYFLANVSNSFEVIKANEYNFDGIGLYRTEMLFMNTDLPYTFLEQYSIYNEAVKMMKGKPITFRTFDVGDDKIIKYLHSDKKGINNYIMNPEIFEAQVSAIMKANNNNNTIKS